MGKPQIIFLILRHLNFTKEAYIKHPFCHITLFPSKHTHWVNNTFLFCCTNTDWVPVLKAEQPLYFAHNKLAKIIWLTKVWLSQEFFKGSYSNLKLLYQIFAHNKLLWSCCFKISFYNDNIGMPPKVLSLSFFFGRTIFRSFISWMIIWVWWMLVLETGLR